MSLARHIRDLERAREGLARSLAEIDETLVELRAAHILEQETRERDRARRAEEAAKRRAIKVELARRKASLDRREAELDQRVTETAAREERTAKREAAIERREAATTRRRRNRAMSRHIADILALQAGETWGAEIAGSVLFEPGASRRVASARRVLARLLMQVGEMTKTEIAAELKRTVSAVSNLVDKPMSVEEAELYRRTAMALRK